MAEIGTFFKTVVLVERKEQASTFSNMWLGNNLPFDEYKKRLADYGVKEPKPKEPTAKEVKNDWNRLASFLATGS